MVDYTQPVRATFELQRKSLEQGQEALEQTVDFQRRVGEAAVDSLNAQESVQHSAVELHQEVLFGALDAIETNVPGAEDAVVDLREGLKEQYDVLLDNHGELFANMSKEIEESVDNVEEFSDDALEAFDEQLDLLFEAHEELEAQSVDAAEEIGDQFDEIQEQAEEMQAQVQEASEQAVESVDA